MVNSVKRELLKLSIIIFILVVILITLMVMGCAPPIQNVDDIPDSVVVSLEQPNFPPPDFDIYEYLELEHVVYRDSSWNQAGVAKSGLRR